MMEINGAGDVRLRFEPGHVREHDFTPTGINLFGQSNERRDNRCRRMTT